MRSRRFPLNALSVLALLVTTVFGVLLFAAKVSAQEIPSAGTATGVPPIRPVPTVSTSVSTYTPPTSHGTLVVGSAQPAGSAPLPIEYAVVQTPTDFPADLSDEEKTSMGMGKVPIHKEGAFRSPFAHPRFGGPAHVKVGLVIDELRDYDIRNGTFDAEFFLSLTSDKDMPPVSPHFTNGRDITETVLVDTPTFKFYQYSGKFSSDVDLRQYPFDSQRLTIAMEDKVAGVDQIVFEPDPARTSLNSEFRMASFAVGSIGARAYNHRYPPRFDRDDLYISRYKFTLGADRFATSAAFSVYVPAVIIVLISLIGMWIPPRGHMDVRSAAGAPMLAAAVLFHYSLNQSLPATGYLTRADKLMIGVYFSLLLNMLSTWAFFLVEEHHWDRWFRWARAWVPPITLFAMAMSCIW